MDTLRDHFIIAMPHLTEATFDRSVVYICEHNSQGSMGLIINRPLSSAGLNLILTTLDITPNRGLEQIGDIYSGGPLQPSMGFVLHTPEYDIKDTVRISTKVSLTTNLQIMSDIQQKNGPEQFRFALGYAGWGVEQLEREIANGDWLVVSATPEFIFDKPDAIKWADAARRFGIEITQFSGLGGSA